MKELTPSIVPLDVASYVADALSASGMAVFGVDLDERIVLWGRGAAALYGWLPGEAMGRSMQELFGDRNALPFRAFFEAPNHPPESGRSWEASVVRARKGGDPPPVLSRAKVLCDPHGHTIACLLVESAVGEADMQLYELRRELETALQQRERELKEAYRIAGLGTWSWDCATGTITWSEEVFRLFERSPALGELRYEALTRQHPPESRARLEAAVERAVSLGEPYELDVEILRPDGSRHDPPRWITARGEPAAWSGGRVAALRGTLHEITLRKRAEQQLSLSEHRYRSLVRASAEIVWTADAAGHQSGEIVEWRAFTGQTREQVQGHGWADAIHPEDRERTVEEWTRAVRSGTAHFLEHRLLRHDGVYRDMAVRAVPVRDPSGRVVEWVGTHTDVTERKQAEAELREREERFRLLAEGMPQMVWVADNAGTMSYCNQRYLDYLGLPAERLGEVDWARIVHPEDLAESLANWRHSVAAGEPYFNEYRLRRHDGVYRHFLGRALPQRNQAGVVDRWIGTCSDVHDWKLAEIALRRSEKLATAGRLAASIAHEINNPLEAITNALYLALCDPELRPETRSFLEMADAELKRVAHMTAQALRFHRQSLASGVADVSEIVRSSLSLFAPRLLGRRIQVDARLEAGAELECFSDDLRQVFTSLLANALDATAEGGRLRVRVRTTWNWQSSGTGIRVSVADTGHGIPAELRPRLFEPFVSNKDSIGIGLGLWVAAGIVRNHHGRIAVRSRASDGPSEPSGGRHGTVVSLFFPFGALSPVASTPAS